MSNSYTFSGSETYSEPEIKAVLGKVYDDFHAMHARAFDFFNKYPNYLSEIRDDLYYLLNRNTLVEFQVQFSFGGKKEAIHYQVHPFGSIYNQDSPSGGTNYYQFSQKSEIRIIVQWNHNDSLSNEYMEKRGWTEKGAFLVGSAHDSKDYTSGNLSMNKSIIRS